jgi:tRNA modification GTPase
MADHTDTIAAVATAGGRGGIGIVRISGPLAAPICREMTGRDPEPQRARLAAFRDAEGRVLDRGIALYYKKPASYTGEDVLELHGHGGRTLPALLLQRVVELGARHASPGEFTQRAFLNGKLDLIQAEAVADLVDSGSERAARSAMRSLEGEFSRGVNGLVQALVAMRVNVEGALDFPEEEPDLISSAGMTERLQACLAELEDILRRAGAGRRLREGARLVILGRPNVGKSSLLNALTRSERAIVTAVPGTTRDLIEDQITLGGVLASIVDTAGIRASGDVIEREGMERALKAAREADVLLLIDDTGAGRETGDWRQELLVELPAGAAVIYINNKIDLRGEPPSAGTGGDSHPEINLSAKTGAGLDLLRERLEAMLGEAADGEDVILARARHVQALERARDSLERAGERLSRRDAQELLAEDLRGAQQALGEITGEVTADDLLGEIFSRFCIGK